MLIGAEAKQASEMLESIRISLETNDALAEDFPEVCYPIQRLEGISNRARGQLCEGEQTRITLTRDKIVLPTVAGSKASGAILKVAGITGRIRGMKHKMADGKSARPDLVIVDDPQTDQSARSRAQCAKREGILAGAVLGLAGPGCRIAGVMPCTVITPGDMADGILDRDKHPEWMGERMRFVLSWPEREDLWQQYQELRSDGLRAGDDGAAATEFYRTNRVEMDRGSEVSWPERFDEGELSAIQHAWNKRLLLGDAAFMAEYQNDPQPLDHGNKLDLTADMIAAKINRMERGRVPQPVSRLTAMIDVQGDLLYWLVAGWQDDFTGFVLDYGAYPDQKRPYFTLRDARPTLSDVFTSGGVEAAIYAGLEALTGQLLGQPWKRDDGTEVRVEKCLIDANWGATTDVIYQFCRQSAHAAVLVPSHGKSFGASSKPMSEWHTNPGDRIGLNWRIPTASGSKRAIRHVIFDTNFWKSFVCTRLLVPMGDRGCLSLFGDRPHLHRLFADHLTSEYRVQTSGRGRQLDEWKARPDKADNHWFDCLVGSAVAASVQGCTIAEMAGSAARPKREKVKFSDLQRQRKGPR